MDALETRTVSIRQMRQERLQADTRVKQAESQAAALRVQLDKALRELKEAGIIEVVWTPGDAETGDLFTKNLARPAFERHASKFVGVDEYMLVDVKDMSSNQGRVLAGGSPTTRDSRVPRDWN